MSKTDFYVAVAMAIPALLIAFAVGMTAYASGVLGPTISNTRKPPFCYRQIDVALPTKAKQHLRKWLAEARPQAVGSELAQSEALRVTMTEDVAQTIERAESYARLRDHYVDRNPAVMGGEPVITGTPRARTNDREPD